MDLKSAAQSGANASGANLLVEQLAKSAAGDVGPWLEVAREQRDAGQAWAVLEAAAERFPHAAIVHHDLARLAEARRDWTTAERCWQSFNGHDPGPWWGPVNLAIVLREQGRLDDAEALLVQARDRFPSEGGVVIEYARLAERRRDWRLAAMLWADVAARFPQACEAPLGRARALREQGFADQARALLIEAVERFPEEPWLLHDLARLAEADADWAAAERTWRRFIALDSSQWWAWAGLADALVRQQREAEGEALLRDLFEPFADQPAVFIDYARIAERSGDRAEASCRWHDVVSRFPQRWEGYVGQARALREQGHVRPALDLLAGVVERFATIPELLHDVARLAEVERKWPDAARWWRQFIGVAPTLWWGRTSLCAALEEQSLLDEATAVLEVAQVDFPDIPDVFVALAQVAERRGDPDAAVRILTDAWARLGPSRELLFPLASAAEKRHDWGAAAAFYRAYGLHQPDDTDAIIRHAFVLGQDGRRDEGDEILRRAMTRHPSDLSLSIAFAKMMPNTRAPAHDPEFVTRSRHTVARFPDAPEAYQVLAEALHRAHRLEDAEAVLATAKPRIAPEPGVRGRRPKISAFVITFNRANILGTCLRSLGFADQLIVVDKSSTDGSRAIAEAYADEVVTVPWTPTVEETRTLALSLCRHEWILFMDDDECLSAEAVSAIFAELGNPAGDIYRFPLRHYILGQHDERAYYWPEHHIRLFRRGAVTFTPTVHAGLLLHSQRMATFNLSDGVCIHHLSHPDTNGWIEKTNRYTSRVDRAGAEAGAEGFAAFAHERIDFWMERTADKALDGYSAAVALLRAVYDMIDAVKAWETRNGLDGAAMFAQACAALDAARPPGERVPRGEAAAGAAGDLV